jgi:two-component system sensor histidine kinase PilS (NtrC family)
MQTGVLVIDAEGRIQLSNNSAQNLLGINSECKQETLKYWVPILGIQLWKWKQSRANTFEPFQARNDLPEVVANAIDLESGETVLYVNNTTAVAQQAQQLKLASLGQLTASIAHEIRNPLSAISHAAELLSEAKAEDEALIKLTAIIQRHSSRVNNIIETILEMSRMKAIEPTVLVLETWLEQFIEEFCEYRQSTGSDISFISKAPLATVYIDANQLHQIMLNLFENAWYYSLSGKNVQRIFVTLTQEGDDVIIDVADNGPGISEKVRDRLFEPFQSQRQGGTGLGLYLARELCQANGARLSYLPDEQGRTCFRINISVDPQKNLS